MVIPLYGDSIIWWLHYMVIPLYAPTSPNFILGDIIIMNESLRKWQSTNLELDVCRLYRYSMEGTQHISQRYWSQRPLLVPLNSKLAQCGTIMDLTAVDRTLVSCTRYKKCNNMPVQRQTGSWRSLPIESEIPRESILFFWLLQCQRLLNCLDAI